MNATAAVIFLVACLGVGLLGTLFIRPRLSNWYADLRRPSWAPPQWLFAPAWTVLYLLMAAAAWRIWSSGQAGRSQAMILFGAQLFLNLLWPALFFGLRRMDWALAEMGLLWIAVAATLVEFWRLAPVAGAMMVPYLSWVSFAFFLNRAYWRLNR